MAGDVESVSLFVPGRLCLFGEHCDWAGEYGRHPGYCLVVGTDQGLSALARPAQEFLVETLIPDDRGRPTGRKRRMSCPADAATLARAARDQDEFFRYCAGTAHELHARGGRGLDLRIVGMDLPLRKGVSSSAAVCILVARAFNEVYRLGLFPRELMEAAYRGEKLTGSQCGRMDQACIYGKTPVLLTFSRGDVRVEPLTPAGEVDLFFVDLAGRKDTLQILSDLQQAYGDSAELQQALGPDNEAILRQAHQAISRGEAETIGRLMTEAQALFDAKVAPHSPVQLASPLLHELLAFEPIAEHIFGGKGVGSQGDGTAQFVARSAADRNEAMRKIAGAFPAMRCFPLTLRAAAGGR